MAKLKIVHLAHSIGGVDVYLRLIIENMSVDSFDNCVIHGLKDTSEPFLDKNGNAVRQYSVAIFRDINVINDSKALFQTYQILKKEKPDLIHAHSAKGGIIGKVMARLLGIRILYTPHAFSYLSTQNSIKRSLFLSIEKFIFRQKVVLLATSTSEKDRALNEVGYAATTIKVFNNCIEPITTIAPLTIPKTWPEAYICTVGRPSYQKNIEQMIRVLHEVKKEARIHLIVMGVGPVSGQLASVKDLIKELGLDQNVTLLDWTQRTDVFNIIKHSKFYISTARYEGMPYAIIESLALAKPCVVSNCDGNKDLIVDNYNGFIINNEDLADFKNKIVSLLSDKELLDKMSNNALISYSENYNIKKNIAALETIYLG